MRILHTSDWHIGRSLFERKRFDEFLAFLTWLHETIEQEQIDVLVVAGDVFDTIAPGNRSQELYYSFLRGMVDSYCHDVVIIAGNHDSPSFLEAPKELLSALRVHVVGSITADPADEVLVLNNTAGEAALIVCAVPFLRDRDIRLSTEGESSDDKTQKLIMGMRAHYAAVNAIALEKQQALGASVPILAMGHLFAAGGKTSENDGVRDLYIGSLGQVGHDIFPATFDYVALGHLHVPQRVGETQHIRYSGSPLPMGFGEAYQRKEVLVVEFGPGLGRVAGQAEFPLTPSPVVRSIAVPLFQRLERLSGDLDTIRERILSLAATQQSIWLEIEYTGTAVGANLREQLEALVAGTTLEILRIRNSRIVEHAMQRLDSEEVLEDLDAYEVFNRCLDANAVDLEARERLVSLYSEIIFSLQAEGVELQEVHA
jgi:DNA repair protein SbcD/Mre11